MSLSLQISTVDGAQPKVDEDAASSLMDEINSIRGVSAQLGTTAAAPPGSKALGIDTAVLVALGGGTLIPSLIGVVREWLTRQPPATQIDIKLGKFEFKWSGTTPPQEITDLVSKLTERWNG